MNIFYYSLLVCLLLLQGCSGDLTVAGGTASETEATITATIVTEEGLPADGAVVYVHRKDFYTAAGSIVTQSVTTNAEGEFTVVVNKNEDYVVEAAYKEQSKRTGVMFPVQTDSDSIYYLGDNQLDGLGSIVGAVTSGLETVQVAIMGSRHSIAVDAQGNFVIDSIPQGYHFIKVFSEVDTNSWVEFVAHTGDTLGDIRFDKQSTHTVLIENFDMRSRRSLLSTIDSASWWFTYSNDTTNMMPDHNKEGVFEGYFNGVTPYGDKGYSFLIELPAEEGRSMGVGLDLGQGEETFDLSALETIGFKGKGTGNVNVIIEGFDADGVYCQVGSMITLTDNWTEYNLSVDELVNLSQESSSDWNAIKNNVRKLVFAANERVTLELDEVVLTGVSIFDFVN